MPYVNDTIRKELDDKINALAVQLAISSDDDNAKKGNLNYVITRLMLEVFNEKRYYEMNDAIGVLECAKLEFYRRRVGPYEDECVIKNGDVY